jgi:hypothetical protein
LLHYVTEEAANTEEERQWVRSVVSMRLEISQALPPTIAPPGRCSDCGARA